MNKISLWINNFFVLKLDIYSEILVRIHIYLLKLSGEGLVDQLTNLQTVKTFGLQQLNFEGKHQPILFAVANQNFS